MKLLLDYGADRDISDRKSATPLEYAHKFIKRGKYISNVIVTPLETYYPNVAEVSINSKRSAAKPYVVILNTLKVVTADVLDWIFNDAATKIAVEDAERARIEVYQKLLIDLSEDILLDLT